MGLTPLVDLPGGLDMKSSPLEVYDYILSPYRDLTTKVLQIGGRAGDVDFWKAAFPKAKVFAVAGAEKPVDQLHFSVIIVAGALTLDDKVQAVLLYARHVSPQGLMVIEGIGDPGEVAALCGAARSAGFHETTAWDNLHRNGALVFK